MRRAASFTAGLAALLAAGASPAADVSRCVAIDDPVARLACYDSVAGRPAPGAVAAPVTPAMPATSSAAPTAAVSTAAPAAPVAAVAGAAAVTAPAASAPATSAAQDFGLSAEKRAARDKAELDEINARVSAVANHPRPGRWVVTLDNGQVWEQREAGSEWRRPRPGDSVTVRKASMGSFLMVVPGRGTFRVARVK